MHLLLLWRGVGDLRWYVSRKIYYPSFFSFRRGCYLPLLVVFLFCFDFSLFCSHDSLLGMGSYACACPFHPPGRGRAGSRRGCRFSQKLSIFGAPPGFSEQNAHTISGAVFVSVPKNTLISRAPNRAGCRKWGSGQEGLRRRRLSGPSGGLAGPFLANLLRY